MALEVAIARPELVSALVVVGSPLPGHDWSETVRRFGDEEDEALVRGDLDAAVEANLRMRVDGPRRGPNEVDPARPRSAPRGAGTEGWAADCHVGTRRLTRGDGDQCIGKVRVNPYM